MTVPESPPAGKLLIQKVDDVAQRRGIVLLLIGPSGAGKTTLLATLNPAKTLVYDVDGGCAALRSAGWNGAIVEAPKDMANIRAFVEMVTLGEHGYATVCIDTVSAIERRMTFALADLRKREFLDVRDYGDSSSKLRQYLIALRDASARGTNIIFVSHEATDLKGAEGQVFPMLSQKLARELLGWCDIVGRLTVGPGGERSLSFAPAVNTCTKTRFRSIDTGADEKLDLGDIFRRIAAEMGKPMPAAAKPAKAEKPAATPETTVIAAPAPAPTPAK